MLVYGLTIFAIFFVSLMLNKAMVYCGPSIITKAQKKWFLVSTWFILTFIEGFRAYHVGTDTEKYAYMYLINDFSSFGILDQLIFSGLTHLSSNPTFLLLVCAAITNGIILYIIYQYSEDITYSVYIFIAFLFYFTSYNAVRQAIAYSVVLLAFVYSSIDKKPLKYIICMVIAICFHKSAILGLVFVINFFINSKNDDGKRNDSFMRKIITIVFVIGIALILYLKIDFTISIGSKLLPSYARYLNSRYATETGGIRQPLMYSLIFICFTLIVPTEDRMKKIFTIPLAMAVIISFIHLRYSIITRFMYYFDITVVLSIPYMLMHNNLEERTKAFFKLIITIVCFVYMLYAFSCGYMQVIPYSFVWDM